MREGARHEPIDNLLFTFSLLPTHTHIRNTNLLYWVRLSFPKTETYSKKGETTELVTRRGVLSEVQKLVIIDLIFPLFHYMNHSYLLIEFQWFRKLFELWYSLREAEELIRFRKNVTTIQSACLCVSLEYCSDRIQTPLSWLFLV